MIQCNALSMPVYEQAPMARCSAMAWTDEREEEERRQKVLVMRVDPTTGATAVTEEQEVPRAQLTKLGRAEQHPPVRRPLAV